MPLTTLVSGEIVDDADLNTNFGLCVLEDTSTTITVTHTWTASQTFTGGFTTGAASTLSGNLLFTDATHDIGASGATRPRDFFLSRNATIGGTLAVTGQATLTISPISRGLGNVATNAAFGERALDSNTDGLQNTACGVDALTAVTTGDYNTGIGVSAGFSTVGGSFNTAVGREALYTNVSGDNNTAIGRQALGVALGSGNVALGHYAGAYETGSNAFYVNNQDRTNTAGDKAKALLYGTFNATAASQTLVANSSLTVLVGFGCNGAAAQTAYASGGALAAYGAGANGFDSGANASALHALVVAMRAALVAAGIMS